MKVRTRFAPSPTGFMHLGNLFGAITDERLAHQSGGVFFLRIEDTDAKREVEGGVETIINVFRSSDLVITTTQKLPTYLLLMFAVSKYCRPIGSPQSQSSWVYGICAAIQR